MRNFSRPSRVCVIAGACFLGRDERQGSLSRFFAYDPNQAYLLPPNVKDVLGGEHLCFRLQAMVEQFDLSQFEQAYGAEGRLAYPSSMMLKVWLYAFCLGVNSTRRLERRIQEDLGFRYLAGGLRSDHKTLSEFLRRHRRAISDVFTQVVPMATGGDGEVGTRGHRFDAGGSECVAVEGGGAGAGAAAVGPGPAISAGVSAEGERTGSGRRRGSEPGARRNNRHWRGKACRRFLARDGSRFR